MQTFDPYRQAIGLVGPGGKVTELNVADINDLYQENLGTCANYGSQIGASFVMLLTIIAMTPSVKLIKLSLWVHILTLVVSTVRMTLLAVYFTSHWTNFYSYWAHDYSRITSADFYRSIVTEMTSLVLLILIHVSLGIQAWALINLLPGHLKLLFTVLSCLVSTAAVSWRIAFSAVQIKSILLIAPPDPSWIAYHSTIVGAVSIFYYCALFNVKLLMHLIKNRGVLPTTQGLSAMEVLVVTNGLLMTVPALFAALEWGRWTNFESGSVTYTSVVVFLPLGTLVASRISSGTTSQGDEHQSRCKCSAPCGISIDADSASSPKVVVLGNKQNCATASCIESACVQFRSYAGTSSVDSIRGASGQVDGAEKWAIRVDREVELYEERI
ncbi:pheromone receptor 2 [Colletotrichum musicola]|uniref:Pheromone receptor 2 n=1 Tax=Colletotrichum musicola TaxID=2175873 RepID=A0A8H6NJD6_9PEZI|nr:pheromone receptor 2 [Colletotrichum musicola]